MSYPLTNFYRCCLGTISLCILLSCNSSRKIDKDFLYFQTERDNIGIIELRERIIQINDQLSITVLSKTFNQQEAALFNMPSIGLNQSGPISGTPTSNAGYVVGIDGSIDFPILGAVEAAGLTKEQLQQYLIEKLTPYVKEPSVTIRSLDFNINVLGEVKSPGVKTFPTDRVTIIDAISSSGDLTEDGRRKDVMVIRREGDKNIYMEVDLTSGALFQSPAYQLQPNDIVYVGANLKKLHKLSTGPNTGAAIRTVGLGLSVFISLLNLYIRVK
ncbi:MAG: polysaccharide biosynthesis/export family protein [Ginsengibacter sp.]